MDTKYRDLLNLKPQGRNAGPIGFIFRKAQNNF